MGANPRLEWQALLLQVNCPQLLITSDPDKGAVVTAEAAAVAKRLLSTLQVTHLPGAGHNIRREQFDAFIATI